MNIANLLARAGRVMGAHTAVAVGRHSFLSYRDLAGRVAVMAGALRDSLGLVQGDRVAILMANTPEYIEILFSCWHAGMLAVPVNSKLHQREVGKILKDSGARVIVATPELSTVAEAACSFCDVPPRLIEVGSRDWRALYTGIDMAITSLSPTEPAWLFYTSGTTGHPKGAILTHRNLLAMTTSYLSDVDVVTPEDSILHVAPMSHGSGLYILPHVATMATQVIPESRKFEPGEVYDLIKHHHGVSFFAAPTVVNRLVAAGDAGADTRGLKTIVYGGGPMYLEDCKKALTLFGPKLAQIYGQGESPMTITVLPKRLHADRDHPRYEDRLSSVGYAQCVVDVVVAGANDVPLPPGEVGEVLVKGDTVMAGYWNMPEATEQTLRKGYLHTGDLGVMDRDGFLTLKGRSKDMIISGGMNIYPREVEEALLVHPDVQEVAVVGRSHPDWGEEVVAFVVATPGTSLSDKDLDAVCTQTIARFKRPKAYIFVPELPKNNYGKVLKTELRRKLKHYADPDNL